MRRNGDHVLVLLGLLCVSACAKLELNQPPGQDPPGTGAQNPPRPGASPAPADFARATGATSPDFKFAADSAASDRISFVTAPGHSPVVVTAPGNDSFAFHELTAARAESLLGIATVPAGSALKMHAAMTGAGEIFVVSRNWNYPQLLKMSAPTSQIALSGGGPSWAYDDPAISPLGGEVVVVAQSSARVRGLRVRPDLNATRLNGSVPQALYQADWDVALNLDSGGLAPAPLTDGSGTRLWVAAMNGSLGAPALGNPVLAAIDPLSGAASGGSSTQSIALDSDPAVQGFAQGPRLALTPAGTLVGAAIFNDSREIAVARLAGAGGWTALDGISSPALAGTSAAAVPITGGTNWSLGLCAADPATLLFYIENDTGDVVGLRFDGSSWSSAQAAFFRASRDVPSYSPNPAATRDLSAGLSNGDCYLAWGVEGQLYLARFERR